MCSKDAFPCRSACQCYLQTTSRGQMGCKRRGGRCPRGTLTTAPFSRPLEWPTVDLRPLIKMNDGLSRTLLPGGVQAERLPRPGEGPAGVPRLGSRVCRALGGQEAVVSTPEPTSLLDKHLTNEGTLSHPRGGLNG